MSQESRVMSHEDRAMELASAFLYKNFWTFDFDDAVDVAIDRVEGVLNDLDNVDVTPYLKDQAAFCVGQYFLDELAVLETENIAAGIQELINELPKPYLAMVQIPNSSGATN